jgi:hypothetical protein
MELLKSRLVLGIIAILPITIYAQTSNISGKVFMDRNTNSVYDVSEGGFSGVTVNLYEDINGNGLVDGSDNKINFDLTNAVGDYNFVLTSLYAPSQDFNLTRTINASENDSYQRKHKDHYHHEPNKFEATKDDVRYKGFRFTNLNIPINATITNANLRLVGWSNGNTTATIRAENLKTPPSYQNNSSTYLSTRNTTGNSTNWPIPNLSDNDVINSPDFSWVVQQLVNTHNGINHLSLILNSPKKWITYNFDDGTTANYPILTLRYTLPDSSDYVMEVEVTLLPSGVSMTTDNIELATFTTLGGSDFNNDFGVSPPSPTSVITNRRITTRVKYKS